jgi:F-type H+-transporting ATPase subunit b
MNLEWQQILTHLLGFAIAVWLLKRYAWGPLLSIMEERRNKIVDEFKHIEDEKENVARLTSEYEERLKDIDNERRAKIVEAVEEGKKVAAEIKADAQQEIKDLHAKAKADLEREVAKAKVQLRDEMIALTMSAAEKVINEKLTDDKHRQLIGRFIDDMQRV